MDATLSVLLILGALSIGVVSPGPSFIMIAKTAVGTSRRDGMAAAVGMGVGSVMFSILALLGVHSVLQNVPTLYIFFKVLGGTYLLYIAVRMWRGSGQSVELPSERAFGVRSPWKSFVLGFLTQISNPKTAVVFASIFAASLPATIPAYMYIVLPPLVFLIEAGWYLVVALLLSSASPQRAYLRMKSPIDRVAGALMGILGLKLIDSAAE